MSAIPMGIPGSFPDPIRVKILVQDLAFFLGREWPVKLEVYDTCDLAGGAGSGVDIAVLVRLEAVGHTAPKVGQFGLDRLAVALLKLGWGRP